MKKKMIGGCILIVSMLMLLPSTTAVQLNTGLEKMTWLTGFEEFRTMDMDELTDFIMGLIQENSEMQDDFLRIIEEMQGEDLLREDITNSNQSIIEKIWGQVLNYRLFRLYVCFMLSVYLQSKITIVRTISWAIRVLRWTNIGIILGIVDLTPDGPSETPTIIFSMDLENNTLTVSNVYPEDVMWSDIDQIGSGTSNPFPTGNVSMGDMITNCVGIIVLRYIPTNEVLGVFEFE
jgi:hypothetical protein